MGLIAWQGWQVRVPQGCDPVRLEGDAAAGQVLVADLERPRLGMRWMTPRRGQATGTILQKCLADEVGALAAAEAGPIDLGPGWSAALLYTDPAPPGRDVFVGISAVSGRRVQVVCHVKRRDRVLRDQILPTLIDTAPGAAGRWAVFDLSCESPAGFELTGQRLLAGDLGLSFGRARQRVAVRQVALAGMALARLPLAQWLSGQQADRRKHYRASAPSDEVKLEGIEGVGGRLVRRRRFCLARGVPPVLETWALHDRSHDRLLLIEATDRALIERIGRTVGWAHSEER